MTEEAGAFAVAMPPSYRFCHSATFPNPASPSLTFRLLFAYHRIRIEGTQSRHHELTYCSTEVGATSSVKPLGPARPRAYRLLRLPRNPAPLALLSPQGLPPPETCFVSRWRQSDQPAPHRTVCEGART